MNIQRLRNLTTGKLHTTMEHIESDLADILGVKCLFTHQLPAAARAVEPWLRKKIKGERFWDGKYDTSHTGIVELPVPTKAERDAMMRSFKS